MKVVLLIFGGWSASPFPPQQAGAPTSEGRGTSPSPKHVERKEEKREREREALCCYFGLMGGAPWLRVQFGSQAKVGGSVWVLKLVLIVHVFPVFSCWWGQPEHESRVLATKCETPDQSR